MNARRITDTSGRTRAAAPESNGDPSAATDRQSMLSAAVDAFNSVGFDATSMGMVAHILGVTRGALYHHIPSKGDLLRQALEPALTQLKAVLERQKTPVRPGTAALQCFIREVINVYVDHLPAVTLVLRLRGNTPAEHAALHMRQAVEDHVLKLVAAAVADGSLRNDVDTVAAGRFLVGMVHSITEWYRPNRRLSSGQLSEYVMAMAFAGLKPGKHAGGDHGAPDPAHSVSEGDERAASLDDQQSALCCTEDWQSMEGRQVEVRLGMTYYRSGKVDAAMPDASGLWLARDGVNDRQFISKAQGFTVWVPPGASEPVAGTPYRA